MQSDFWAEGRRKRSYFPVLEIAYGLIYTNSGSNNTNFFSANGAYPENKKKKKKSELRSYIELYCRFYLILSKSIV